LTGHQSEPDRRFAIVAEDGSLLGPGASRGVALRPRMRHGRRPGPDESGPCLSDTDCADDEICFGGNCT
jgi:hypothetical protein